MARGARAIGARRGRSQRARRYVVRAAQTSTRCSATEMNNTFSVIPSVARDLLLPRGRKSRCLAALGMTIAIISCSKPAPQAAPAVPVRVAQATQIAAPLTIAANGVVEPMQTVSVQAQVGGTLMQVGFHEGDEVRAGQILFRLDPRPFQAALRQAEGALARDEVQAANTQREADRYKALAEKD